MPLACEHTMFLSIRLVIRIRVYCFSINMTTRSSATYLVYACVCIVLSNTGANERSTSRARSASSNVSLGLCKSVYYLVWTSLNETAYVCACIS